MRYTSSAFYKFLSCTKKSFIGLNDMNKPGQRVITALILAVFMISVSGVAGVLGTSGTGSKLPHHLKPQIIQF